MKITIAGGTGFLGRELEDFLSNKGHVISILTRKPKRANHILWNAESNGSWVKHAKDTDVIINLCGKSVDCRYTAKNKKEITESRIGSTNAIHNAIESNLIKPRVWLNASSATIYIHAENELMNEENGIIGDDFSMRVCKLWEKSFFERSYASTRQVALRTSIVLSNSGGAYSKLKPLTKLGFGGKQGRGQQKVSWIDVQDFCRAVAFIIQNKSLSGL